MASTFILFGRSDFQWHATLRCDDASTTYRPTLCSCSLSPRLFLRPLHQRVASTKAVLPRVAGRSARLNVQANKKVAKKTNVVLTVADPNLGNVGDLVEVSTGFFRNHLEPMGKAKKVRRRKKKNLH